MRSNKRAASPDGSPSSSSPSTGPQSKKPRRMTESQLSRKRELDRAAQRNSRARTRNRIDYLETLVSSLRADSGADRVAALLRQLDGKEAEIQRLTGVLNNIGKQLALAANETPPPDEDDGEQRSGASGSETDECPSLTATSERPPPAQPAEELFPGEVEQPHLEEPSDHLVLNGHDSSIGRPSDSASLDYYNIAAATGLVEPQCQSITQLASSISNNTQLEGRLWYLAGAILNHILGMPDDTVITTVFDEEIAIRAVFHGWSSVIERYSLDRGWQWLKELDERIYFHCPIPLRLIHLRNCRLMFLNQRFPDDGWGALIPPCFAARPSGAGITHDALVEYFPWPKFREKLISSPRKFATNKFMNALVAHVEFTWNLNPHDLYKKDPLTGLYQYSELTTSRLNDIRSCNLSRDFFNIFPELRGDIPCRAVVPQSLFPADVGLPWTELDEDAESLGEQQCKPLRDPGDIYTYHFEDIGSPLPAAIRQIHEIFV